MNNGFAKSARRHLSSCNFVELVKPYVKNKKQLSLIIAFGETFIINIKNKILIIKYVKHVSLTKTCAN